jgi:hypothetical protein
MHQTIRKGALQIQTSSSWLSLGCVGVAWEKRRRRAESWYVACVGHWVVAVHHFKYGAFNHHTLQVFCNGQGCCSI